MPSLRLESATDSLALDSVMLNDEGVEALAGVTGLGLPPVSQQWLEGAGDGATPRGRRVLPRDIDIPIYVLGPDRQGLKDYLSRLAVMLSGKCTLYLVEDGGVEQWYTDVFHVGGGDYSYGIDTTGEDDLQTVITLRAGDPYWTSINQQSVTVGTSSSTGLLTGNSLATFTLSSSQALGSISLANDGDAPARPVWTIVGPGTNFVATSPTGEVLSWQGTLSAGQALTIDTATGLVVDNTGANRYSSLASRPRFWFIPGGTNIATVSMTGTTPGVSKITCAWRARKRAVI